MVESKTYYRKILLYLLVFRCKLDYSFSRLKKNVKNMMIFLAVSLNLIKWFDLETCQPNSLSSSSIELNRMLIQSETWVQRQLGWPVKIWHCFWKNFKMTICFLNIETMPDWIYLGHPMTWIMDFNEFNNFVVFVNYLFLNFMIKLDACKIKYQP